MALESDSDNSVHNSEESTDTEEEEEEADSESEEDSEQIAKGNILRHNDSDDIAYHDSEMIQGHIQGEVVGDTTPIPNDEQFNQESPLDELVGWLQHDFDPGPTMDPFAAIPGLEAEADDVTTPCKIFHVMFDDEMFETMAMETNRFASNKKAKQEQSMLSINIIHFK